MTNINKTTDLVNLFHSSKPNVKVAGWVNSRRDHGGLIFIDLRDCFNLVQVVFSPENMEVFQIAKQLRAEWVIEIKGILKLRDDQAINKKLFTGELELIADEIRILNKSQTPPIRVNDEDAQSSEEKRLRYRYLDLRRPSMQHNLKYRALFYKYIRDFMHQAEFTEVPTPILANSSPEGARDFLVASRLYHDKFYALPQAPQQFKQLLMVGGLWRYYQIASCFRDEDPRADRLYGDFYQLDLEMAFVEDADIVRQTVEPLVKKLIIDFANLKLFKDQFFCLTYDQALNDYGTDKPDLRFGLKLKNVNHIFKDTQANVFKTVLQESGTIVGLGIDNLLSKKQIEELTRLSLERKAKGLAYLIYEAGAWQGPLVKFLSSLELEKLTNLFNIKDKGTIFLVADVNSQVSLQALGVVRSYLGEWLNLKDSNSVAAVWVIDFPFFEIDEDSQQLVFGHNPFSRPKEDIALTQDKLSIKADQFDLVLNGYEVCSGASRNYDADKLIAAFQTLGYDLKEVDRQFGAMLNAFKFGAPPHAGCAFGLDRLMMILLREENIRELVAFPKNGSGVDLMMNSPASISKIQRKELGLS